MNHKLILCLALVLGGVLSADCRVESAGADNPAQSRLEQMAQTYSHFSLTVVIENRALRLWPPMEKVKPATNGFVTWKMGTNALAAEQLRLAEELRALSGNREALVALLRHTNPKVRTLALGAIFQREDGRDLPLIASLINDPAQTFPNLHDSMNSAVGERPMSELENPQSVADVAQAMLAFWGVPPTGRQVGASGRNERVFITTNDFAEYWKKYAGRDYAASWFAVKMKRATRQTTPIQPQYQPDIQRVLAEMKALPLPDRAWIQLYVLAPYGNGYSPETELVASTRKLGPASLLRFLQRRKVSDDPDLLMDKENREFARMTDFILGHADHLLRAEDADALLACENAEHDSGGVNPAWAIGAALVQPARAGEILHNALAHETRSYETAAGALAGALWRIRGPAEMDFLVNWFYTVLPTASEPMHQPLAFLWEAEAAARPDTKQLIAALVKDSRFDYTDWTTLKELLKIVNAGRSTPLVKERDIYDAQPNRLLDDRMIFPVWRNLLRRQYGLPELPLPSPAAKPKHILTQPAWAVRLVKSSFPALPSQIVPSSDGKWLAMLINGTITIWKAETGEFWWQIPRAPAAAAFCMAFEADGQRLMVFDRAEYGRFSEWNIATRQPVGQVLLTGKPQSGVDQGAYGLDHAALHAIFSGYNDLVCFDTRNGEPLWSHPREGGVRSLAALSWDGTRLAAGGGCKTPQVVSLYDATSGTLLQQFDRLAGPVLALALSSDGLNLVTATSASGVQLWDATSGKLLKEYAYQVPGFGQNMSAPAISPDGRWLAVVGASAQIEESRVGVFRTDSGELEWEIQVKADASIGSGIPLAFSPDGKTLYTGAGWLAAWLLE
jgi:outer membrane protein assembly factor BamB